MTRDAPLPRGPSGARAPLSRAAGRARAGWDAAAQSRSFAAGTATELHLCARPRSGAARFADQARSAYESLAAELKARGASPGHLVSEKIFLGDVEAQSHALLAARSAVFSSDRGIDPARTALTLVRQPPAREGRACEIQAVALIPRRGQSHTGEALTGLPAGCTGRLVETGGLRHLFLSGVAGGVPGDGLDFERQAHDMFHRAEGLLEAAGFTFGDVTRTWIYVKDIDADYGLLNLRRREFYTARGVEPAPASTGIRGTIHLADRACAMDLRAVAPREGLAIRTIHAPTLNEAPSYGSDFSRGIRVDTRSGSLIYLSGTASIDTDGCIVASRDIEGQVERMLVNVESLLAGQGARYGDLVSAVTYLKRAEYLQPFRRLCRARGMAESVPNTICVTDICRFEWLCEMEAVAALR